MNIIKKTMKFTILIGVISIIIFAIFGLENQLLKTQEVNGITIKIFDIKTYMENVNNSLGIKPLDFDTILPPRTWINENFNILYQQPFWDALSNNLALILDWIYFPLNFILYIIRWLAYVIRLNMALIGWPIASEKSVLSSILNWIQINLIIPYL